MPITPPRLELADRQRGLAAVYRLIDRLKRSGLRLAGIQILLRAGEKHPEPMQGRDLDPEHRPHFAHYSEALEHRGLVVIHRTEIKKRAFSVTLTPKALRILGL
jgi:DNA-binding transcriptional MerR regulator